MTLIQVIDAARNLANEPLDSSRTFPDNTSTFWKDSTLVTYFNMIQHDVEQEIVQTFEDYFLTQTTLSIVSGCAGYTLPARFMKVRRMEDFRGTGEPIEIHPITLNERGYNTSILVDDAGGGYVNRYSIRGNELVFDDTPTFTNASAIRMFYIRSLGDLSAGTESSDIPVEHHRVMVWGLYKMMLQQQQADTTKADEEYQRQLLRVKTYCENRQIQRPRRVKSGSLRGR